MQKKLTKEPKPTIPYYFYYLDMNLARNSVFVDSNRVKKNNKEKIEALKKAGNYFETLQELCEYQNQVQTINILSEVKQ